ncbi:MAG: biotin--[acetyl-CoA-carboxylase] ligase [Butyrivibrio sp.]|nr:biotin--[acetyl-CoA-carboxylase] ligase [Acetatifactor muris]MCM1558953.1 biotin--[acetyl-CoA-carboxylase] ligase [Butyrivibrio sp.]
MRRQEAADKRLGSEVSGAADRMIGRETAAAHAMYDREALEAAADTAWAGKYICYFNELDSTNLRAKLEADNGAPEGTLVVADMQTAGRGRRGRSWSSPGGTNVYFTLILRPSFGPDKAPMVTLVMALAVAEGIYETCGLAAEIKWPNDVIVHGKKVCGILTEMSADRGVIRHVVIGVGVNVGQQEFPPEIAAVAASLQEECGEEVSRTLLTAHIMKAFEKYYESFRQNENLSGVQEKYNSLLVNRDREVRVLDPKGEFRGIARGITPRGELLVEREDGSIQEIYAGEVSVRGVYGYV